MLRELKPYPEQGDVLTWEGRPPAHWKPASMRAVTRERDVSGVPDEPLLSVSIRRGVTTQASLLSESSKRDSSNLDRSAYKLVEPGDIAYNKMRAWQGAAGLSRFRGIVSPAYVVLQPERKTVDPMYLHFLVRMPAYAAEAARWSYGITSDQWSLRPEHFRRIPIALPPLDEQTAIVTYLTHAHRRINHAIVAKRCLIALLEEQKSVVLDRAVTLGLDPGAAREASRVIWIGDIPAGWKVAPTKRLLLEGPRNGVSPRASETGDLRTLSIAAVRAGSVQITTATTKYVDRADVSCVDQYRVQSGDVMIVRGNGRLQLVGRAGMVVEEPSEEYIYPDLLMRVRLNDQVDPVYFLTAFASSVARQQIETAARTAVGTFKVNSTDVRNVYLPLPPLEEQRAIVAFIGNETANADREIELARREVALLEEFRTRLTADVVTGQVDVRRAAEGLPTVDPAEALAAVGDATHEVDEGLVDDDELGEDDYVADE